MPLEHRLYYGDFRDVDGMKWPFRLRHAVAGQTIEETTFDRIRINVKIDARKFEVPK
jgi:predicted thioesterase